MNRQSIADKVSIAVVIVLLVAGCKKDDNTKEKSATVPTVSAPNAPAVVLSATTTYVKVIDYRTM
jgi:uncharacterized lipoprotein YajG